MNPCSNLIDLRKAVYTAFLFFISGLLYADSTYTITVHFQYGSKPAKGYKNYESKRFGGMHGGHVMIQLGDSIYGFVPYGRFHLVAHRRDIHSAFVAEDRANWISDTASEKYLSIVIPIDSLAHCNYIRLQHRYLRQSPYDYAFIGMRCAAATYDLLSNGAGILKQKSKTGMVYGCFYPKKLRKKLMKYAVKNACICYGHKGRSTRKWERG